jgi:hypothetical protein
MSNLINRMGDIFKHSRAILNVRSNYFNDAEKGDRG